MIHQKICVSEFYAVRKVCDLPSVPLWDSQGQIASCVPCVCACVCIHMWNFLHVSTDLLLC